MRIKFVDDFKEQPAVIRVVGLGGAGGNAVNRMIEAGVAHVEFISANTDAQALRRNLAPVRLQLGEDKDVLPFVLLSLATAFLLLWAAEQWLKPRSRL